jgi:O-antigen/teichoic acid export membrane protein
VVTSNDCQTESDVPADEREALLSIAHGAVVTSGGVSIQRGLIVTADAILTRMLGPAAYGVYALAWQMMGMLLRFSDLGTHSTLLRDIPAYEGDSDRQRRVIGLAYGTTAVVSFLIAGALVLFADRVNDITIGHPEFPPTLRLFAVVLVAFAFVRIHGAVLKATGAASSEVVLNRLLRSGVRLVAAVAAMWAGYSVVGVAGALAASVGTLAVFGFFATMRVSALRPTLRGVRAEAASFYDHAVPTAFSSIGGLLRTRVDVLLIGALLTAEAAGLYNIVLLIVGLTAIPLVAFNQLMPPVSSGLYAAGKIETLNNVYTTISRMVVTTTVPFIAVQIVYGPELLGIFGPEYVRGYLVLLVFLVGRVISNAVGATGHLLQMTNNHYVAMVLEWILAVLNVVLTYVFVVEFGLVGAALGTSVAIAAQNLIQVLLLYRLEGLWPFDATFLKPVVGGLVMGGVMAGVDTALAGPAIPVFGTVLGLAACALTLLALGLEPRDRLVVHALGDRYRRRLGTYADSIDGPQ